MIQELLSELKNKYQYDDNLLKAIEITVNLMIRKYGENATNDILDLFREVKIATAKELNETIVNDKTKEIFSDVNPRVIEDIEEDNIYGNNAVGSVYSYVPIFSDDMEVIGESSFIIVNDKKGTICEKDYYDTFGTTINMPYFIHEVNHAYAMQKPKYVKKGNQILAKHGLFTSVIDINKEGEKFHIKSTSSKDIIFEEMINQMLTQDMLVDYFNVSSYSQVKPILDRIKYVPSEYDTLLVFIGRELNDSIGESVIMDLRRDNNEGIIDEINSVAENSDIAIEYLGGAKPFDYFIEKNYDLFQLIINKYKYKIEKYTELASKLVLDSLASVYAIADKKKGTVTLEQYKEKRERMLSKYNNPEMKIS